MFDKSLEAYGQIDILVCNAAVNPYFGPLSEFDVSAYERTMDANVKHTLLLCNRVLPQMAERKNGSVIIVSSHCRLQGHQQSRDLRDLQSSRDPTRGAILRLSGATGIFALTALPLA